RIAESDVRRNARRHSLENNYWYIVACIKNRTSVFRTLDQVHNPIISESVCCNGDWRGKNLFEPKPPGKPEKSTVSCAPPSNPRVAANTSCISSGKGHGIAEITARSSSSFGPG